jgi:hypothetical protein
MFTSDHYLFESTNPGDIGSILDLPYPLYNDIILKQYEEKKKQKEELDKRKRVGHRK